MKKNLKFIVGVIIIVMAIVYLGVTGFQEEISYYVTVDELDGIGDEAYDVNLRVAGQVVMGSIDRSGKRMTFEISQNDAVLPVVYIGEKPVPDTFKEHAETVVKGVYRHDGVFEADHIQAKCASKYEAMIEEATIK